MLVAHSVDSVRLHHFVISGCQSSRNRYSDLDNAYRRVLVRPSTPVLRSLVARIYNPMRTRVALGNSPRSQNKVQGGCFRIWKACIT